MSDDQPLHIFDDTKTKRGESKSGIIHVCDVCGCRERWNLCWSTYGSLLDEDCGVVLKTCGCRKLTDIEASDLLREKRIALRLSPRPRIIRSL